MLVFAVEATHQMRGTPGPDAMFTRLLSITEIMETFWLTVSKVVRELHDLFVETDARRHVLPRAAVTVQEKVVVFLGHVYAVAVRSGSSAGLGRITKPIIPLTGNRTNAGLRRQED